MVTYGCPMAALVHPHGRQPGRSHQGLQVGLQHILLGRRRPEPRLRRSLEPRHRPTRRSACLWANDPDGIATSDKKTGIPPALESGRLHGGQPGPVHQRHRGLLQRHQPVQVRGLRMPGRHSGTRRTSRTSGSSACSRASTPKRRPSPGPSSSVPTWTRSATSRNGLCLEVWWEKTWPFKSAAHRSDLPGHRRRLGQPTQNKPYTPALGLTGGGGFDVIIDVIKRTANLDDPASYVDAIKATDLDTILGHIKFNGPVRQLRHQPAGRRPVDRQRPVPGNGYMVDNSHYPVHSDRPARASSTDHAQDRAR